MNIPRTPTTATPPSAIARFAGIWVASFGTPSLWRRRRSRVDRVVTARSARPRQPPNRFRYIRRGDFVVCPWSAQAALTKSKILLTRLLPLLLYL